MQHNIRSTFVGTRDLVIAKLGQKHYVKLVRLFMEFISKQLLLGYGVNIPGLGEFRIVGYKLRPKVDAQGNIVGLPVDWKATKDLWKRDPLAEEKRLKVYLFNDHSDNYLYSVKWFKNSSLYNARFFTFTLRRKDKRQVKVMDAQGVQFLKQG